MGHRYYSSNIANITGEALHPFETEYGRSTFQKIKNPLVGDEISWRQTYEFAIHLVLPYH